MYGTALSESAVPYNGNRFRAQRIAPRQYNLTISAINLHAGSQEKPRQISPPPPYASCGAPGYFFPTRRKRGNRSGPSRNNRHRAIKRTTPDGSGAQRMKRRPRKKPPRSTAAKGTH